MIRRLAAAGVAVALGLLPNACESTPPPDNTLHPRWRQVSLPAPPGQPGRLMVRDAVNCDGQWYVVGAVGQPNGDTRPAAWTSADGVAWTAMTLRPRSYYGVRSILTAVGCGGGRIAIVGAKAGGAHGNPRVRTWYQLPDGSLAEFEPEFLLFQGPAAVSVNRVAGDGPGGWLIAGNRDTGAAVWLSADASSFRILEGAPQLANGDGLMTTAFDVVAAPPGWLVTGEVHRPDRLDRDAMVWSSADGRAWTRVPLPATTEDESAQRLVRTGDGVLALGARGPGFGAWRRDGGPDAAWTEAGRFGRTGTGAVAGVEAATASGDRILAATVGANGHHVWFSPDRGAHWRAVAVPLALPAGGYTAASVAAHDEQALLVEDAGTMGGLWLTDLPAKG